jgi:hypothetical protein
VARPPHFSPQQDSDPPYCEGIAKDQSSRTAETAKEAGVGAAVGALGAPPSALSERAVFRAGPADQRPAHRLQLEADVPGPALSLPSFDRPGLMLLAALAVPSVERYIDRRHIRE